MGGHNKVSPLLQYQLFLLGSAKPENIPYILHASIELQTNYTENQSLWKNKTEAVIRGVEKRTHLMLMKGWN